MRWKSIILKEQIQKENQDIITHEEKLCDEFHVRNTSDEQQPEEVGDEVNATDNMVNVSWMTLIIFFIISQ